MAYFEILDIEPTHFTVRVSELQYDFTVAYYNNIKLNYWAGNDDWITLSEIQPMNADFVLEYKTVEFVYYYESGGLQNGAFYRFLVSAETATDGQNYIIKTASGDDYLTIEIPSSEGGGGTGSIVPKWTWEGWTSSYNAITNKTATTNFSYKAWNEMVSKVLDVLHNGIDRAWDKTYANYSDTRMFSSEDTELTAIRFNSIRNNIELAGKYLGISKIPDSEIPHPVYSGYYVLGEYFLILTDYINDCIDNL